MFTGIIEEIGRVAAIRPAGNAVHMAIRAAKVVKDVQLGDSIAVNGVCLTVTKFTDSGFEVDVVPETMRRTALGILQSGSPVNLEAAMTMGGRFGGHIVAGHIDGVGTLVSAMREDNALVMRIEAGQEIMKYVIPKGSITIDGVSLTVMDRNPQGFRVSIIPHTEQVTILGSKRIGDPVNLECDMIGKYVEQFLQLREASESRKTPGLTMDTLRNNGFLE
jgi:riboflavin synthase